MEINVYLYTALALFVQLRPASVGNVYLAMVKLTTSTKTSPLQPVEEGEV